MKVLAVSFDEYRDSEQSICERVEIFGEFLWEGGYACIDKEGMVVVGKVENMGW